LRPTGNSAAATFYLFEQAAVMAIKKRLDKRRVAIGDEALAWLDGEEVGGFFELGRDNELEALWLEHGDDSKLFWRRGMFRPITKQDLKAEEDGWLLSAVDDRYQLKSYFVFCLYTDDEKRTLWDERRRQHSVSLAGGYAEAGVDSIKQFLGVPDVRTPTKTGRRNRHYVGPFDQSYQSLRSRGTGSNLPRAKTTSFSRYIFGIVFQGAE
jgi:hypothetical protein